MENKRMKIIKMYGLTILLCLPLIIFGAGIFFLRANTWLREMSSNLTGIVGLSVLVGMIIVTFLFYKLNAKFFERIMIDIATIYDNHMTEKSEKNLKLINNYILDKYYYLGETIEYKELSPTNGVILISVISLMCLLIATLSVKVALILWTPYFAVLGYNYYFRTITISEEGVLAKTWFKKTFIKWEEVNSVGVTTAYCYVSKNKFSVKRVVRKSNRTITFTYRSKIFHHIYAYWHGNIEDLEFKKAWLRYLEKHAELKETNTEEKLSW